VSLRERLAQGASQVLTDDLREAEDTLGSAPKDAIKRSLHYLLIEEMVAMFILLAAMTIFSTFINAPLRELANANLTPNPSKAPWYFLGLQELLRYFHPMVAGITIPTFILVGLAALPYVDRSASVKPGDRKVAITMFTLLFMFGAILTIIGSFFRGPGYNWVWPWAQGVFFEL